VDTWGAMARREWPPGDVTSAWDPDAYYHYNGRFAGEYVGITIEELVTVS
jgi:hypothetical protein